MDDPAEVVVAELGERRHAGIGPVADDCKELNIGAGHHAQLGGKRRGLIATPRVAAVTAGAELHIPVLAERRVAGLGSGLAARRQSSDRDQNAEADNRSERVGQISEPTTGGDRLRSVPGSAGLGLLQFAGLG